MEPIFGENIKFLNNTASIYGDDIASVAKTLIYVDYDPKNSKVLLLNRNL